MSYSFDAWATHVEDPVGAAVRANVSAARKVADAAHDYHSAVARGDPSEIQATKQAFRLAWESDVRRKGGRPEDFIPDYHNVDPVPGFPGFFFGQVDPKKASVMSFMATMAALYILWMFLA